MIIFPLRSWIALLLIPCLTVPSIAAPSIGVSNPYHKDIEPIHTQALVPFMVWAHRTLSESPEAGSQWRTVAYATGMIGIVSVAVQQAGWKQAVTTLLIGGVTAVTTVRNSPGSSRNEELLNLMTEHLLRQKIPIANRIALQLIQLNQFKSCRELYFVLSIVHDLTINNPSIISDQRKIFNAYATIADRWVTRDFFWGNLAKCVALLARRFEHSIGMADLNNITDILDSNPPSQTDTPSEGQSTQWHRQFARVERLKSDVQFLEYDQTNNLEKLRKTIDYLRKAARHSSSLPTTELERFSADSRLSWMLTELSRHTSQPETDALLTEAESIAQAAEHQSSNSPQVGPAFALGYLAETRGHWDAAVTLYEEAIARDTRHQETRIPEYLGGAYLRVGRLNDALVQLLSVPELTSQGRLYLMEIQARLGNYDSALSEWNHLHRDAPSFDFYQSRHQPMHFFPFFFLAIFVQNGADDALDMLSRFLEHWDVTPAFAKAIAYVLMRDPSPESFLNRIPETQRGSAGKSAIQDAIQSLQSLTEAELMDQNPFVMRETGDLPTVDDIKPNSKSDASVNAAILQARAWQWQHRHTETLSLLSWLILKDYFVDTRQIIDVLSPLTSAILNHPARLDYNEQCAPLLRLKVFVEGFEKNHKHWSYVFGRITIELLHVSLINRRYEEACTYASLSADRMKKYADTLEKDRAVRKDFSNTTQMLYSGWAKALFFLWMNSSDSTVLKESLSRLKEGIDRIETYSGREFPGLLVLRQMRLWRAVMLARSNPAEARGAMVLARNLLAECERYHPGAADTKLAAGVIAGEDQRWNDAIDLLSQVYHETEAPQAMWELMRAYAKRNAGEDDARSLIALYDTLKEPDAFEMYYHGLSLYRLGQRAEAKTSWSRLGEGSEGFKVFQNMQEFREFQVLSPEVGLTQPGSVEGHDDVDEQQDPVSLWKTRWTSQILDKAGENLPADSLTAFFDPAWEELASEFKATLLLEWCEQILSASSQKSAGRIMESLMRQLEKTVPYVLTTTLVEQAIDSLSNWGDNRSDPGKHFKRLNNANANLLPIHRRLLPTVRRQREDIGIETRLQDWETRYTQEEHRPSSFWETSENIDALKEWATALTTPPAHAKPEQLTRWQALAANVTVLLELAQSHFTNTAPEREARERKTRERLRAGFLEELERFRSRIPQTHSTAQLDSLARSLQDAVSAWPEWMRSDSNANLATLTAALDNRREEFAQKERDTEKNRFVRDFELLSNRLARLERELEAYWERDTNRDQIGQWERDLSQAETNLPSHLTSLNDEQELRFKFSNRIFQLKAKVALVEQRIHARRMEEAAAETARRQSAEQLILPLQAAFTTLFEKTDDPNAQTADFSGLSDLEAAIRAIPVLGYPDLDQQRATLQTDIVDLRKLVDGRLKALEAVRQAQLNEERRIHTDKFETLRKDLGLLSRQQLTFWLKDGAQKALAAWEDDLAKVLDALPDWLKPEQGALAAGLQSEMDALRAKIHDHIIKTERIHYMARIEALEGRLFALEKITDAKWSVSDRAPVHQFSEDLDGLPSVMPAHLADDTVRNTRESDLHTRLAALQERLGQIDENRRLRETLAARLRLEDEHRAEILFDQMIPALHANQIPYERRKENIIFVGEMLSPLIIRYEKEEGLSIRDASLLSHQLNYELGIKDGRVLLWQVVSATNKDLVFDKSGTLISLGVLPDQRVHLDLGPEINESVSSWIRTKKTNLGIRTKNNLLVMQAAPALSATDIVRDIVLHTPGTTVLDLIDYYHAAPEGEWLRRLRTRAVELLQEDSQRRLLELSDFAMLVLPLEDYSFRMQYFANQYWPALLDHLEGRDPLHSLMDEVIQRSLLPIQFASFFASNVTAFTQGEMDTDFWEGIEQHLGLLTNDASENDTAHQVGRHARTESMKHEHPSLNNFLKESTPWLEHYAKLDEELNLLTGLFLKIYLPDMYQHLRDDISSRRLARAA